MNVAASAVAAYALVIAHSPADKEHPLSPGVPEVLGGDPIKTQPVALPLEATYPDFKKYVQQDLVVQARQEVERSEVALARANRVLAKASQRASETVSNPKGRDRAESLT